MKKILALAAGFMIIAMAVVFSEAPQQVTATGQENKQVISVSGKGEVTIQPDVAYIRLGLISQGATAKEAQQKNANEFDAIRKAIESFGVKAADIKTVQFNTHADYQWEKEKRVLKGYQTQHIVQVTYRDMEKIGSLLDAVTKAGANEIQNIEYSTEKREQYEIEALQKAMDHAKKKADALAAKTGKKVIGVVSIQESGVSSPIVYGHYAAEAKALDSAPTQISTGEMKIEANIQVEYQF